MSLITFIFDETTMDNIDRNAKYKYDIDKNFVTTNCCILKLKLKANQNLYSRRIIYPLIWEGIVNEHNIKISQLEESTNCFDDFEFQIFPESFSNYKQDVVKVITTYTNTCIQCFWGMHHLYY